MKKVVKKVTPTGIKCWKIDVRSYKVKVSETQKGDDVLDTYDVKGSLVAILWNVDLKLTVDQAFEQKELADRIREAKDFVIVDQQEYARIKAAYNAIRSPSENDLEFFKRIRDAEQVEATAG